MAINKQNLRVPTSEEARRNGALGGKARARNKLAMEKFKDLLIEGLSREEKLKMLEAIKKNAKKGNLPSFEFLLKMMGEHPDQTNDGDNTINIKIGLPDDDYGN